MTLNLKSIFDRYGNHLTFDERLLTKIKTYEQNFATKNQDHIEFFGGATLGVQPVRFKTEDRNRWFDDILEMDESDIESEMYQIPKSHGHNDPPFVASRHVSVDVMNLSCLWVCHKFITSTHLTQVQKDAGVISTLLIVQYKFITSLIASWFRYNADPVVAQATYNALNKRFGIKAEGSWSKLLKKRAGDIGLEKGLWRPILTTFDDDYRIVESINDIQGRIRSILKYIYDVFAMVNKSPDMLIRSSSTELTIDDETKIRDKSRQVTNYIQSIQSIISDKRSFIVKDLVTVICKLVPTAPRNNIVSALEYMSANVSPKADPDVLVLAQGTIQHAYDYMLRNPEIMANSSDVVGLLQKMRALYQASRGNNPKVLELREIGEGIATRATKSKNASLISSIRNAILLYVVLRTFTSQHS